MVFYDLIWSMDDAVYINIYVYNTKHHATIQLKRTIAYFAVSHTVRNWSIFQRFKQCSKDPIISTTVFLLNIHYRKIYLVK